MHVKMMLVYCHPQVILFYVFSKNVSNNNCDIILLHYENDWRRLIAESHNCSRTDILKRPNNNVIFSVVIGVRLFG